MKYEIKQQAIHTGEVKNVIVTKDPGVNAGCYFAGYNPMGGVEWETDILGAYYMDLAEARAIRKDLEAADSDPVAPEKKQYLVKTSIEDEQIATIMTGKDLANFYEQDQLSGVYGEIKVYDIEDEPKRISLLDLVEPILAKKRWMDQEYREYCEKEWWN